MENMDYMFQCPQADSNRCLGLERAPSWATRRWGLVFLPGMATNSYLYRAGVILS